MPRRPWRRRRAAVHWALEVNAQDVYCKPHRSIPFRDITAGSNGYPALTGYDLATGLGAWSYTPGAPTGLIVAEHVAGGNQRSVGGAA